MERTKADVTIISKIRGKRKRKKFGYRPLRKKTGNKSPFFT